MKTLLTILLLVCFCASLYAAGTLQLKATNTFMATHDVPDSAGTGYDSADSVNVTVTFQDGTVSLDSAWYNSADAQAVAINDALIFYDAWDDMNGTDGVGTYTVYLRWYDGSGAALEFQETYIVQQTTRGLEDSSIVDVSAAQAGLIPEIVDSTWDEVLTGATHNVASSAGRRLRQLETGQVLLTGTINTANDSTATLGLSGNYPDGFFDHNWLVVTVGTDSVQIRQINVYTGATDSVSMAAAESWVIVPANGDEWEIIASTGVHVVDLHTPVVLQIVAADYDKGIWIDDNSGNTNTELGVDGTIANPVSTFTAARTIADALGYQKYYLVNNSILTLAATHEDWEFIGIGEGSLIDFGSQDVDGSIFTHLMISGTQGGTGVTGLHDCYLNTIDSLEAIVINSSFSDTISVRVSGNTLFDQCYSNVAGNNTPGLDFNSAGTINVSVRHYSGGLALFNGTATHTISYESDGQLVIDASCTSINVTARGNMTITDNGTTTALTADAVYNKGYVYDTTYNSIVQFHEDSLADANITQVVGVTGSATNLGEAFDGDGTSAGYIEKIKGLDAGAIQLGDADIRYAGYLVIGTVEDSAGNTAALFQTDLSAANNDYYNFATLVFIEGNNGGLARPIGDYTGASGVIKVVPAFVTIPAVGDSFAIVTSIAGIMPFSPESTQIKLFSGLVGPDFDNTGGGLDSIEFNDSYYHAIAVASDSGQPVVTQDTVATGDTLAVKKDSLIYQGSASGLTAAGIWQYEIRDDTTDGAVDDTSAADHLYSASLGGAGGADTTDIIAAMRNNFRIMPEDKKVRFIDDDGDDSDGLTPATAWQDFSKVEDSTGYTFYVFPGTYTDPVCKITESNVDLISTEWMGGVFLRNTDDTLKANTIFQINPDEDELIRNIRIIGFNIGYKVSYTTTPPDPSFQAAIWAFDSTEYVEIAHCFVAPDSGFKSLAVEDEATKYYYIHDNHFVKNYTHSIDFAADYSIIENNTIIDQRGYLGGASGANTTEPIQITTSGEHNVIRGNYINYGSVLVRLQGDNTLVANNYLGYSVANDGRWIEGYAVGADTGQQNVAAGNWSRAFTPDTSAAGSKLDSLSTVSEDLENIYNKTNAYTGGDGDYACSLLAYDGSSFISPANVRMTSGVQEFTVNVSPDGWAVFALDGGTWTALVTALRYVQDTIPQTFTFSANIVDTLTMTTFSPSTPTDTGMVNLYVWTDSTFGATYAGATFRVIPLDKGKNWVTGGGRVLPLGELTKTTDSTGYAEIEVYQSSFTHPYPSGSDSLKYNISITYPGLSSWAQFRFVAPDSGNQYQIGVIE